MSPKDCSSPARRVEGFGDVLVPQVFQPAAALENPMSKVTLFRTPAQRLRKAGGTEPYCVQRRPLLSRGPVGWPGAKRRNRSAYRSRAAWLLAGGMGLLGMTQAAGEQICKPALTLSDVKFSEMRRPTLERKWTAIVSVDASRCTTTSGHFEVVFSRLKEIGVEVEFRERFVWSSPSVTIGVDFWADEAVERYWIDGVQACPCAR